MIWRFVIFTTFYIHFSRLAGTRRLHFRGDRGITRKYKNPDSHGGALVDSSLQTKFQATHQSEIWSSINH